MRTLPFLLLLAPHAVSQTAELWVLGSDPGDQLGTSVAACGDVNADGYDDWIVGAPKANANGPNSGSALVYSGLTGGLLYQFDGASAGIEFGRAVAGAGDVNGDGFADLIVGSPRLSDFNLSGGGATVFSGIDGSILYAIDGPSQFGFTGSAVAGAGDTNGDGKADFVVGTPYADNNGADSGVVQLFSGATGLLIREHLGDTADAHFGTALHGGEDVNGDGFGDYIIGAPGDSMNGDDAGQVKLISGVDGIAIGFHQGTAGDLLGSSVALLGDLGFNGKSEYAFGSPGANNGAGRLNVKSDTHTTLFNFPGTNSERLGTSVAGAGDPHDNGVRGVLVGAPFASGGGRVLHFNGTGTLLGELPRPAYASRFGTSVAGGFDTNGDGRDELLVGDPRDTEASNSAGRATLYSTSMLGGESICDGSTGLCPCANGAAANEGCMNSTGSGASLETSGTASVTLDVLQFHSSSLPIDTPAVLFTGTSAVNGGVGVPFKDGLLCTNSQSVRMGVQFADAGGQAQWGPGIAAEGEFTSGTVRYFQVWFRDAGGTVCGSGSNTSNALRVAFSE